MKFLTLAVILLLSIAAYCDAGKLLGPKTRARVRGASAAIRWLLYRSTKIYRHNGRKQGHSMSTSTLLPQCNARRPIAAVAPGTTLESTVADHLGLQSTTIERGHTGDGSCGSSLGGSGGGNCDNGRDSSSQLPPRLGAFLSSRTQDLLIRLRSVVQVPTVRNTTKIRLRQELASNEVYGSNVVVETDQEQMLVYSVQAVGLVLPAVAQSIATQPSISPDAALSIVVQRAGVTKAYMSSNSWNVNVRLIIYQRDGSAGAAAVPPKLCYIVSFYVQVPERARPLAPHAVVDALGGQIIAFWNGLAESDTIKISGVGGNYGSSGLKTYTDLVAALHSSSSKCVYGTDDVQVQNMAGSTSYSNYFSPWAFDCDQAMNASFDAVNGGYSPLNDVVENSQATLSMYQSYFKLSPTCRLPLKARVHYGTNYENAFWDGTQINIGDGGDTYYPLTSLDAVAHEYSHGFTDCYSALQYSGQSGGINEAFSDMAGEAAKYFVDGTNDFTFGSTIAKKESGWRSLCNPTANGRAIDHASNYRPSMDVHYSSGVYSKAFCLLAKSDGWATDTAFITFAVANMLHWRQLTNFTEGACGVIAAAVDLGLSKADVAAAFSAVGVSC